MFCVFFIDFFFLLTKKNNWVCEVCQFDAELGWNNIANAKVTNQKVTYTTNSLGFRSNEIDKSKEHILILGDSVAFGVGVNDNETVSHYIQKETPKYQVQNLASVGYSIDQYYLKLKKHIHKFKPKYVISIIFSGNDWFETIQDNMWGVNKPFYKIDNGKLTKTNQKLSMFSCINYFHASWFLNKFNNERLKKILCNPQKHENTEGIKVIGSLLKKIEALGNSIGAKTAFILSPTMNDFFIQTCGPNTNFSFCESNMKNHPEFFFKNKNLFQEYLLKKAEKEKNGNQRFIAKNVSKSGSWAWYLRFKNLFKENNIKFLDNHDKLMKENVNIFEMYLENDEYHYSSKGNQFLAKAILEHLDYAK